MATALNEDAGTVAHDEVLGADNQDGQLQDEEPVVQLTDEDLKEARERAELSLLARIFWEEPRELRVVENSFLLVWKCGRVRVFDVGSGLYQFIFPSVSKRDWVLNCQPWFFQRSIIHFTDVMTPSEDLFHSLQFMPLWVKIIGVPFSSLTIAVGRKLLSKLGEVIKVGYFDAGTPEGTYVKGRVRMDLLGSFLGTTPVSRPNGTTFPAFFQYIGVPCICYLCGFLGHVMSECSRTDLVFDENVRALWICGKVDPDEKEGKGPQIQPIVPVLPPNNRGRGGLPPSVAAGLSSNLNRQWTRERNIGGPRGRGGPRFGGPRPVLALPGPPPVRGPQHGHLPGGLGSTRTQAQVIPPLQILAPDGWNYNGGQRTSNPRHSGPTGSQAHAPSEFSVASGGRRLGQDAGLSSRIVASPSPRIRPGQISSNFVQRAESSGVLGPLRAPKVSLPPGGLPGAELGPSPFPVQQAQATPQSKLQMNPLVGQSSRSNSSSGSAKRKLLSAFEAADGLPAPKSAGPKFTADGPCVQLDHLDANGPLSWADEATRLDQPTAGSLFTNNDNNFDPDALFVSGSEEGEISMNGDAEEPDAVEVADPDRPPIIK
ncbi:hypothetical protein LINPERPRIM_LOCUS27306 [Linum perenne]